MAALKRKTKLKALIEGGFWHKLLISFLAANVLTLFTGISFVYKNYYMFLDTIKAVEHIQIQNKEQDKDIRHLQIIDANHDARLNNLEKK